MTCFPLSEWSSSVDKLEALELDLDRDVCDDEPGAGSIDDEGDGRGGSSGFFSSSHWFGHGCRVAHEAVPVLKKVN